MRAYPAAAAAALLLTSLIPSSSATQSVFQSEPATTYKKPPFGRFLHITDLHPDPHYEHSSAVKSACHRRKPKPHKPDGKQRAGWWGTALSDCDSPPRLVESSLSWASTHLAPNGSLDFVIWTGDSARHDNDDKLPRSSKEIFDLNRWTLEKLEEAFPGVPLVPTVGNNDIFPHNILFPGPNQVTKEYVSIWQDHIPEYEFHTFEQGGYFVKDLIPNRLAAMSLNTLYFYDNNKAVDGCTKEKGDPGTAQLDWLEVQLNLFRGRGMQVHLLGHVPPTAGNYFKRCYDRYTDIVLRNQDTVVGQHFGHMNTDAFFVQEDMEAVMSEKKHKKKVEREEEEGDGEVRVKEEGLPGDLKQDFSTLPGRGRTNEDYYSVFFIAPSIIPTYWPSMRLWTYNTSEEGRYVAALDPPSSPNLDSSSEEFDEVIDEDEDDDEEGEEDEEEVDTQSRHHHRPPPPHKRKGKKHRKHRKKRHPLPRHASPLSPSRTNTYLSLLGYSQWIMDIDSQNEAVEEILHPKSLSFSSDDSLKHHKHDKDDKHDEEEEKRRKQAEKMQVEYRLEYATYEPSVLWSPFDSNSSGVGPVPKPLLEEELKRAKVKTPYTVKEGKVKLEKKLRRFTDYGLENVTVGSMMDLARRLMVDKKLWKRFVRRIYAESGYKP